ncbi:hypothetical protein M758_4G219100, partial [Ceratodon purpureus]
MEEMMSSSPHMEPLGQQGLQDPNWMGSWNPASSPSPPLQNLPRAAQPPGSRLGSYSMPSLVSASPKTSIRKNDKIHEIFDISDYDKDEIRLAFELFDTRKVGRLCYRDLKVAMRALECHVKKAEVKHLMEKYSKDDNNEIGLDEFMQIMLTKYKDKDPELNILKVFSVFDEEGKGKISIKNIRKVARELGEVFTDEQLEAMIEEFDKDEDGFVTKDEFYNIMKKNEGM